MHNIHFRDRLLSPVWDKIQSGERLSLTDGVTMFQSNDLIAIGKMAHAVQQQKSGDAVYFVLNQKIEPTNICVLSCKFCDFATKAGKPNAYEMTIADIIGKLTPEIQEVHITGGLHSDLEWELLSRYGSGNQKHFPPSI